MDTKTPPFKIFAKNIAINFAKGFGAGFSIQYAIAAVQLLLKEFDVKNLKKFFTKLLFEIWKEKHLWEWGLFLGGYLALFRAFLDATKSYAVAPSGRFKLDSKEHEKENKGENESESDNTGNKKLTGAAATTTTTTTTTTSTNTGTTATKNEVPKGMEHFRPVAHGWPDSDPTQDLRFVFGRYRPMIAGAIASFSVMAIRDSDTRSGIVLFFLVRAMEIFARYYARRGFLPNLDNSDTYLMMFSSAAVIGAYISDPSLLNPAYNKFLLHQGGKHPVIVHSVGDVYNNRNINVAGLLKAGYKFNSPAANAIATTAATATSAAKVTASALSLHPCDLIHPGQTCSQHFLSFFIAGMKRAYPVYLPVYILPVLFSYKMLLEKPTSTLRHAGFGVIRSSVFLSMYCTSAWVTSCVGSKILGMHPIIPLWAGATGGSAVIIEKKGRRLELGLYVFSQAIPVIFRFLKSFGVARDVHNWDLIVFALASATIMQAHMRLPDAVRPSYRSLLRIAVDSQ